MGRCIASPHWHMPPCEGLRYHLEGMPSLTLALYLEITQAAPWCLFETTLNFLNVITLYMQRWILPSMVLCNQNIGA